MLWDTATMSPLRYDDEFPPVSSAAEDGLLLVGGRLTPERVLAAYQRGIFPWPIVEDRYELLAWFSPDPRAIIELDQIHVSRRLARRMRSQRFRVTCDQAFSDVVVGCATARSTEGGTWITPDMARVYGDLRALGHAHSIEVWQGDVLVGGLYGVSLGGFFAGESMFHRARDASKVALVVLVAHLRARGFRLLDVQQATEHAVSMGATEIRRSRFVVRLREALTLPVTFGRALDLSQLGVLIGLPGR
jgi:leucyl/phenylalanyl-tRNA--protein transferase